MSIPKRHHYNPQYYLRHFENDEGRLWRLDKETGKVVCGSSRTFGFQKHWNRLDNPPEGIDENWAEHRLAQVDDAAARVIRRIVERDPPENIAALALAISFIQNHQPQIRRGLKEQHPNEVWDWDEDTFLIREIQTAMNVWQEYDPINYAVIHLGGNCQKRRFLSASNPLVSYSNKDIALLPISRELCLILNQGVQLAPIGNGYMEADGDEVIDGINRQIYENSWQYVYSSRPDFESL